jgi:hypothetical protein
MSGMGLAQSGILVTEPLCSEPTDRGPRMRALQHIECAYDGVCLTACEMYVCENTRATSHLAAQSLPPNSTSMDALVVGLAPKKGASKYIYIYIYIGVQYCIRLIEYSTVTVYTRTRIRIRISH